MLLFLFFGTLNLIVMSAVIHFIDCKWMQEVIKIDQGNILPVPFFRRRNYIDHPHPLEYGRLSLILRNIPRTVFREAFRLARNPFAFPMCIRDP